MLHSLVKASSCDSMEDRSLENFDKEREVILSWLLDQLQSTSSTTGQQESAAKLNRFQQKLFHDISPHLLTRVSNVHLTFLREYIRILMSKAEELNRKSMGDIIRSSLQDTGMDTDDTDSRGGCDEEESGDLDVLLNHFKRLAQSGEAAKAACVSILKSKIQPPSAVKLHLPPVVGTIWNRILHAVSTQSIN